MAVRFNPPPGWRVPPGFRPDAGWAPDPAWPPAPPGWEYWVHDDATAVMAPVPAPPPVAPPVPTPVPTPLPTPGPTPVATVRAPHPPAASRRTSPPRPGTALLAVVAVSCVALGCILGFMLSIGQTSDAAQAVADAQRAQDAATTVQTEVAQERADLDAMRTELEQREQAVRDRETELAAKQAQLATHEQELADQAAAQAAASAPGQAVQPAQDTGTVWFENCKAARRAGAAPIPQGHSGYRPALDKNGNGLACEEGD